MLFERNYNWMMWVYLFSSKNCFSQLNEWYTQIRFSLSPLKLYPYGSKKDIKNKTITACSFIFLLRAVYKVIRSTEAIIFNVCSLRTLCLEIKKSSVIRIFVSSIWRKLWTNENVLISQLFNWNNSAMRNTVWMGYLEIRLVFLEQAYY